jgi:hypothetical protein
MKFLGFERVKFVEIFMKRKEEPKAQETKAQ